MGGRRACVLTSRARKARSKVGRARGLGDQEDRVSRLPPVSFYR